MFKFFFASAIVALFAVQSVSAGDCCCGQKSAAPAAADQQAKADTNADQAQQAQRPSQARSYSYEPEYQTTAPAATNDGFYAGRISQDPRIIGSYGHRPASDKSVGKY